MPDINFPSSPSGGDTYTFNNITFTYDGEKWTAKAPVTSTSTYGDANVAAYASSQGFIDLTDISVTSNSPSGNGSLSYNNGSGVFTFTPADASGSGGGGIQYADLSVSTGSASGNGTLSYNNGTGVFTFAPADTSLLAPKANPTFSGNISSTTGYFFVQTDNEEDGANVRIGPDQDEGVNGLHLNTTTSIAEIYTDADSDHRPFHVYAKSQSLTLGSSLTTGLNLDTSANVISIRKNANSSLGYSIPTTRGTNGQVLTIDGSGVASWGAGGITSLVDDTTPQLGGALDVSGQSIISISNGDIPITPNGSGQIILDGLSWPTSDGSANQVLQTDGNGSLSFATLSGGGTDSQDLTLSGNVISLTGQSGNVDLTSLLATQPTTVTADSTDGTTLLLDGGDASGLNSTGGNVDINAGTGALQNGVVNIGDSSQGVNIGANSSTAINVTGPLTINNQLIIEDGVSEKFSSLTGATGVVTHDCDNGHIFYHSSISANFTANFTNLGLSTNYGTTLTLILDQGATARIPSAVQISGSAQTINWQGGSAPTGTNNGVDAVSFTILRVSGNYVVLGQLVDFT